MKPNAMARSRHTALLRRWSALVSLVLIALSMPQTALSATKPSASPKEGGTLIFGRGGDSVGLDPAGRTDGESFNVTDHIFDNLVSFKSGTTDVEPALAESWEITPDGLNYTFKLRKDVKFHDGEAFNADAVIFSFKRQLDPKHPAHNFGKPYIYFSSLSLDTLIKDVVKIDDHTVRFVLSKSNAPFISTLGMQAFAIVSPKSLLEKKEDFNFNPVGTGPFRFVRWDKNQRIVLQANPDYWDGKPFLKTLIFRAIPDNSTRLMEMMAGKLHVMDNPNANDLNVLKDKMGEKVTLATQPGFNIGYMAMNQEKKPFDNVLVRRAINHVVNKEAIIKAVYAGYATAAKNPMPPTLWGYNDKIEGYEYDVAKAKNLMKQAGLADGFETTLWAMPVPRPYMPDGRKVAEAIQGDLAKIGIKAKIVSYDWGTYLEKTRNGEHDMALLGWTGDIGDPDNFLYVLLDKDNAVRPAQNIAFYKSDELHELLIKAQQESNTDKRIEIYKTAQEIIHRDAPLVPIAHSVDVVPHQEQVNDFVMDPTGRRRFAKVWLGE